MTDNYNQLNKFEKLTLIQENRICFSERKAYAKYLRSLWLNDIKTINFFESFGNRPTQIISNYRTYERNLIYGFKEVIFNGYGWLETAPLLEKEEIIIYEKSKNDFREKNYITVAKGYNDSWTYGYSICSNTSGSHSGACVWGSVFATKEEAIIEACERVIDFHKKTEWKLSSKVSSLASKKIQETKNVQWKLSSKVSFSESDKIIGFQLELF